jgi:hypothetical protein
MRFSFFREYGAMNSTPVFDAFERSLLDAGHTVLGDDMHSDVAVIWSVLWNGRMVGNKPIWEYFQKTGRNVIVLEVGGIKRGTTWKVGLNGINRDAYFGSNNNNSDRHRLLGLSLKPWRTDGEYILICGQHDKSLQWQGMPRMSNWVMNTIEEIQTYTDMPIVFRPHPRCPLPAIEHQYKNVYRDNPQKLSNTYDDYNLSFSKAHAVVSWSSNPGPLAILSGIPVFAGPSSLAYDVSNIDFKNIEYPLRPNRKQWLNDYAHTEYTIEEISQGLPLKNLTNKL